MRIFLFGKTGMLGGYIYNYFLGLYDIIDINRQIFDAEKNTFQDLLSVCDAHNISCDDVIINCVGLLPHVFNSDSLKDQNFSCEILKKFILVNTVLPHHLEKLHLIHTCKVIHITSDCVYAGNKGSYTETDEPDLFNIYGISKTSGEPDQICNIRTSIIGHENHKRHLLEWIILQRNKNINGYSNYLWNGVTCLELSKIIHKIIQKNKYWKGTRHIYSPDTVSKFELCQLVNQIYDLNMDVVQFELPEKIDRSLSSIYEQNLCASTIKEQLIELRNAYATLGQD